MAVVEGVLTALEPENRGREVERLRADVGEAERAIGNLTRARLRDWRALLTTHTREGRQLLREVLAGPLRFAPDERTYRFEGEAAIGRMLAGMAGVAPFVASPTGFARIVRGWLRRPA